MGATDVAAKVPFKNALRFWFELGFISFGGPAGQIAIMHREIVEKRRWIDEARFLHALNFCMVLPGPEAQQLATYIGWLMHGVRGGIVAGALFVLPSVFILLGLSWLYVAHGHVAWIAALFAGLQPAVLALIASAALRIGKKALDSKVKIATALAALVALREFDVAFPWIIAVAALLGWFTSRGGADDAREVGASVSTSSTLRIAAICLVLWWTPVVLAGIVFGWKSLLVEQGTFFSQTAMVTFGGAYAVLPYVADHAVTTTGWLAPHEMLDGLGLAETTPGPLIMVLQFVGFVAGWRNPGALSPGLAGTLSALMTTWVTFLPCFLWVFVGAPYVERLRGITRLSGAMAMVSAAVVGVIANLAAWFAVHALWSDERGLDWFAIAVSVGTFVGLQRWKWPVAWVLLVCAMLGGIRHQIATL